MEVDVAQLLATAAVTQRPESALVSLCSRLLARLVLKTCRKMASGRDPAGSAERKRRVQLGGCRYGADRIVGGEKKAVRTNNERYFSFRVAPFCQPALPETRTSGALIRFSPKARPSLAFFCRLCSLATSLFSTPGAFIICSRMTLDVSPFKLPAVKA